jgi:hypothetical protein
MPRLRPGVNDMSCPERVGFPLYPFHYLNLAQFSLGRSSKKFYAFVWPPLEEEDMII